MTDRLVQSVYIEGVGAVAALPAARTHVGSKVLLKDNVTAIVENKRSRYLGLSIELTFKTETGETRKQTFAPADLIALG